MKRLLIISSILAISGATHAMDQGQALMDAINRSDLEGVKNSLNQGFINVCQKIGTQSPLEAACKLKDSNPVNNTTIVSKALIDYALDHVVEITDEQGKRQGDHVEQRNFVVRENIRAFIKLMAQCRIDYEEIFRRIICTCAAQKRTAAQLIELLGNYHVFRGEPNSLLREFNISKGSLKNCTDLIADLIENYSATGIYFDDRGMITYWVSICIEYGAPVDTPNKSGFTPLQLAVQAKEYWPYLIPLLLTYGEDPNRTFIHNGKEYTAITFVETLPKDSTKAYVLKYLKKEVPLDLPSDLPSSETRSFATNFSKIFASYKTWVGMACLYLGIKCYKRVTSGYAAKYEQNMLINEAGAEITMTDDEDNDTKIAAGDSNTTELPKETDSLVVKFSDASKNTAKDLNIDLGQYEDDLDDYFINITIRPTRWYERLFIKTTLTYSVSWKQKPAPQQAK